MVRFAWTDAKRSECLGLIGKIIAEYNILELWKSCPGFPGAINTGAINKRIAKLILTTVTALASGLKSSASLKLKSAKKDKNDNYKATSDHNIRTHISCLLR